MRGKRGLAAEPATVCGITPADAGKTQPKYSAAACREDHPRGCGENRDAEKNIQTLTGSPPRMRGKRNRETCAEQHAGITPADAGKTGFGQDGWWIILDHPRGCGENPSRKP